MQTASNYIPQNSYPATVPLSVYRDLAAELQAAQAHIQQLTAQNQQIVRENQLLRQEIANTVQAVMHLQNIANGRQPINANYINQHYINQDTPNSHSDFSGQQGLKTPINEVHRPAKPNRGAVRSQPPAKRGVRQNFSAYTPQPETVYIEEQEISYYSDADAETSAMNSWWMLLAIALIVLTAFGAGYLVVKPLIDSNAR